MPPDSSPRHAGGCLELRLTAEEHEVRSTLRKIRLLLAERLSPDDADSLELALAEVLNNIVEHAYAGRQPGQVSVWVARAEAGDALLCRVEDDGRPVPGMTLPEGQMQPIADRIEDLAEGGWGWALIRALTEEIVYERQAGRNRLHFRLPLTGSA
jgi:serine/threonine-protein kinase RsbW